MSFAIVLSALVSLVYTIFRLLRTINVAPKEEASKEEKILWLSKVRVSYLLFLLALFICPFMILSVLIH